jgi:superfamily I DNA/RNA helicase
MRSEAHALERFLAEILLQQGFEQQDVTILELNPQFSPLSLLPKPLLRNIQKIDVENLKSWPFRGIGVSSVRDFKGLESNVICLVGAREINSIEEARNMLYVAMSRARALLWIANTPEFDAAVKEIGEHQA